MMRNLKQKIKNHHHWMIVHRDESIVVVVDLGIVVGVFLARVNLAWVDHVWILSCER
jgi:hypothetical protein